MINTILEKPVTVSNGWKPTEEFESIFEMVESRLGSLYDKRTSKDTACGVDPLLERVNTYTKAQVDNCLHSIEKSIEKAGARSAEKAVKENEFIKNITKALNLDK